MELNLTTFFPFPVIHLLVVFLLTTLLIYSKKRPKMSIQKKSRKDKHGYLKEWTDLNERLGTIVTNDELITEIKRIVKQGLQVDSLELVLDNLDTELMQWLFRYGEPILVTELSRVVPRLFEENKIFLQGLNAQILVSLYGKHKLLGLLAVGKKLNRRAFTNEDRQLIKIISRQVAIVILSSKLTSDLAVSQEMQQVSKLSSFLIQDLKSFISTLSSVVQNAAVDFDNPKIRKDSLSTISGTINKMNCLMEKLSTMPNKLELVPRPTNINVVIEEAITRLRIDDMSTIRLLRLFEYVPQLNIDAESFQKAIQNLIFNAMDSMPKGGTLTIKTSYQEGIGVSNGSFVQIMVRDTGCGMSNDFIQQRLFKPFQSNKHQGLGIGLFQSKAIVEAHGGKIQVESQEGKGSTFTINLPVQRRNPAFQESVPKNGAGLKGTPP